MRRPWTSPAIRAKFALLPTLTLATANRLAILIVKHRRDLTDAR